MPITLVSIDNTLVINTQFIGKIISTGLRYCYISPEEADSYFETMLNVNVWENSTRRDKEKALSTATKIIDKLNYKGNKPENQYYEFPRVGQESIPIDIQHACAEIAYQLLDGFDLEIEMKNLNVSAISHSSAKTSYNSQEFISEHIRAGIPSIVAWMLLKPYLVGSNLVKLVRTL